MFLLEGMMLEMENWMKFAIVGMFGVFFGRDDGQE